MSAVAPLLQAKRTWSGLTAAGTDQKLVWIIRAVREFENASVEGPIAVADNYSANSTFTPTTQLNVTSPTAANIAAVLAGFLADARKRGVKKST
jgi:hypothetical protein